MFKENYGNKSHKTKTRNKETENIKKSPTRNFGVEKYHH